MENLNLNQTALFYLSIVRKWAKFISIFMFIMIGFMVIAGFFMGFVMSLVDNFLSNTTPHLSGGFFTFFYLLMALIYFFPVLYLYRFSEYLGRALQSGMEDELTTAFRYLKNHYNYVGVLMIIGLIFMVLGIIVMVIAAIIGVAASSGGDFL